VVRNILFAVPGDLATPTGGYAYDRRIIAELAGMGWPVEVLDIGGEFPFPSAHARRLAGERLMASPHDRIVIVDGLALGVLPDVAHTLCARQSLVALVHHPLALETGLTAAEADRLRASERAALAAARHVIVTSGETARRLAADYAVAADKITVARPGSDPATPARGSSDGIVRLLSVGALVPRKGFDVLLAALERLADLPWRLTIAGDRTRDPRTAALVDVMIARAGFGDRISVVGAVPRERLALLHDEADLFVLASRFEGYGMAYAEALAHGLPVIGTTAGAIPETVPAGCGILVPPGDPSALARALTLSIGDAERRRRMAKCAREAASRLPRWQETAATIARALERLA